MNVTWVTGCAGTANVSIWSAATSVPATRDTNLQRTDWSVLVRIKDITDYFLSKMFLCFVFIVAIWRLNVSGMCLCFSASQTLMSAPLRMVAVRLSAPTQRVAMSAAATLDMPWCLIWEAALVRSFVSVIVHLLSCVCYSELYSWQFLHFKCTYAAFFKMW